MPAVYPIDSLHVSSLRRPARTEEERDGTVTVTVRKSVDGDPRTTTFGVWEVLPVPSILAGHNSTSDLAERLADTNRRSDVATSLYLSALGLGVAGIGGGIGAMFMAFDHNQSTRDASAVMAVLSLASFVGQIVTLSIAISYDRGSAVRRQRITDELLRERGLLSVRPIITHQDVGVAMSLTF